MLIYIYLNVYRQMMQSMVHLSNGQSMVLQYDSAMTAAEVGSLLVDLSL